MPLTPEERKAKWKANSKAYYENNKKKVKEYHALHRQTSPLSYSPASLTIGLIAANVGKILGIPRKQVVSEVPHIVTYHGRRYTLEAVREYAESKGIESPKLDEMFQEREEFVTAKEARLTPERRAQLQEHMLRAQAALKVKRETLKAGNVYDTPTFRESRRAQLQREYDELLAAQGGVCAMCKQPPKRTDRRMHRDHNHATGQRRGLLCSRCNNALWALEQAATHQSALDYLKQWGEVDG